MLQQVNVKDSRISRNEANNTVKGSSKLGSGQADFVLKADRFTPYTTILQAFYGLPGIIVKQGGIYRIGRTISLSNAEVEPMVILLDGSQINLDLLDTLPPSDVEGVEILTSGSNTALYGSQGYWGVILVTTKKGPSHRLAEPKSYLDRITLSGYSTQREFYAPVYDADDNKNKADLRSTIYWQPNVITNERGNAEVSFYTADKAGTYNIITEGLNTNGKLARKTFEIIVN
ncbi:TonB-dependent receptor plug domain-containing protein [Mucilaginibacter sp. RB4R14]|uniref:TonB-dependent receptor n=1 Tax=Mucilaginibacter aurantiaciroseus TaxID=2949308 RepID=UPI002090889E|nr:TonB-dependent receptor plug domain-containing protein [Mucilaginibacter aurantiaciroseus]MCO5936926.1 TonB-dependent receptor plug domain-containing protein [Mucilaginibacter aurantiaciroseus]